MDNQVRLILAKVASSADFACVELVDVNTTNSMGDNALHCVCLWGDVEAAKALINAGINIDQFGERGYTPLHIACMAGHIAVVELLVAHGADLFAQSEGDLPFTTARLGGHDAICDYLSPLMTSAQASQRSVYIKSRIEQLRREISRLESSLD